MFCSVSFVATETFRHIAGSEVPSCHGGKHCTYASQTTFSDVYYHLLHHRAVVGRCGQLDGDAVDLQELVPLRRIIPAVQKPARVMQRVDSRLHLRIVRDLQIDLITRGTGNISRDNFRGTIGDEVRVKQTPSCGSRNTFLTTNIVTQHSPGTRHIVRIHYRRSHDNPLPSLNCIPHAKSRPRSTGTPH